MDMDMDIDVYVNILIFDYICLFCYFYSTQDAVVYPLRTNSAKRCFAVFNCKNIK